MTSPHVIAPIETSATSGSPSELGMPIASGFVPATFGPSGGPSRGGRRRGEDGHEAAFREPARVVAEHPRRERPVADDEPRPLRRRLERVANRCLEREVADRAVPVPALEAGRFLDDPGRGLRIEVEA